MSAKDWYEQALVTESHIKAFFGMTASNQTKLIREASARATVVVPSTSKAVEGTETVLGAELEDAVEAVELEEVIERLNVLDLDSNFEEQTLILDAE